MDAERIDALVNEAESMEAQAAGPVAPAESGSEPENAVVVVDKVEEAEQIFALAMSIAGGIDPVVEKVYDAERVRKIAEAWVPLAEKRGWDLIAWLSKWGPEIGFVIAVVPPPIAKAIVAAIKAKVSSKKAPAAEPAKTENGTLAAQGDFKQSETVTDNGGALAPA